MAETIRESIDGALRAIRTANLPMARKELRYVLAVLNAAERGEDGRRLVYDWDDETIRDVLPSTLDVS